MMGQPCAQTWEVELPRSRLLSKAQQIQHFLAREHGESRDLYRSHAEILGFEHEGIDEGDAPRQPYTASAAQERFPQKPGPGKQTLAAQTFALRDIECAARRSQSHFLVLLSNNMDFRFKDNVIGGPHTLADVRHQGLDLSSRGMTDIDNKIGMDRGDHGAPEARPL
jgi:hypothetical protein